MTMKHSLRYETFTHNILVMHKLCLFNSEVIFLQHYTRKTFNCQHKQQQNMVKAVSVLKFTCKKQEFMDVLDFSDGPNDLEALAAEPGMFWTIHYY